MKVVICKGCKHLWDHDLERFYTGPNYECTEGRVGTPILNPVTGKTKLIYPPTVDALQKNKGFDCDKYKQGGIIRFLKEIFK